MFPFRACCWFKECSATRTVQHMGGCLGRPLYHTVDSELLPRATRQASPSLSGPDETIPQPPCPIRLQASRLPLGGRATVGELAVGLRPTNSFHGATTGQIFQGGLLREASNSHGPAVGCEHLTPLGQPMLGDLQALPVRAGFELGP